MFTCDTYACVCMKDIENVTPREDPKITLKLSSDANKPLHFSYFPKEGLCLTGPGGKMIEGNILGKLLSLPANDIDKQISFFESYGFYSRLSPEEYSSIDSAVISEVTNRIKATIRLMNAIGRHDYRSMLINVSYLLFSEPVTYSAAESTYSSCMHPFTSFLNGSMQFPDVNHDREIQVTGSFSVEDSIAQNTCKIPVEFINAIRSGAGTDILGSKSPWFKTIVALYLSKIPIDNELRLAIEFYYHLFTEHFVIKSVASSKVSCYGKCELTDLSDAMLSALEKITRMVIAEEINHNISAIHPRYDGESLSAAWQVNNLIEALYFSIFYMKAGIEIYKECGNPNCKRDKYFLVEATRNNKKYCCPQCANAAAAQRHRNRKLKKSSTHRVSG